ncbi:MAG: response regulator [Chloroflexales bacterium]|nr:response regulator [Chloroflexales bacterium]
MQSAQAGTMKTILVVDDEGAIIEVLRGLLEDEGYRVVSAANGYDGLARVAQEQPDLIISDVMMPRMGGLPFARALQQHPDYAAIPLVLASAGTPPPLDGIAAAFLPKPFDFEALLATIRRLTPDA